MRKIVVVAFAFCCFTALAADDSLVSVMAKGMGVTVEEALKDSFQDAVERAVGVFVDAEQQVENDQLIRDQILTQSNGYIENYRKVSERKGANGLFEVKIVAKVKKAQLTRKLKDTMPTKTFSLGDELKRQYESRQQMRVELERQREVEREEKRQKAAREVSQEKRDDDAAALIQNTLADFNPTAMMVDVTETGAKPTVETVNGEVTVGFDLCLRLSKERYFNTLLPRLKQLFGQIALEKPIMVKFLLKQSNSIFAVSRGLFRKPLPTISVQDVPAGSGWLSEIEIGGVACRLPDLHLNIPDVDVALDDPTVWIVDKVLGSGAQVRVTMIGYKLSKKCVDTLKSISRNWGAPWTGPVEFVADLIDSSGEVVTAQKFSIVQDCGWIGWGGGLKEGQGAAFYVMPWMSPSVEMDSCRIGKVIYRDGLYYDTAGNCLGKAYVNISAYSGAMSRCLADVVPFRCKFKVLEEELKSISTIRVRVAE